MGSQRYLTFPFNVSLGQKHMLYLENGCFRHMKCSISLLNDYINKYGHVVTFVDSNKVQTNGHDLFMQFGKVFKIISYVKGLRHSLIVVS